MRALQVVAVLLGLVVIVGSQPRPAAAAGTCKPLGSPAGPVVEVDTVAGLEQAVADLTDGTTILIADGTYDLTKTLVVRGVDNIAIRGASGDRGGVVLRGKGMANASYGDVPHVVAVFDADDVLIADLTLRDAYYHLVQIHGEDDADRTRIHNVHLIDAGEQFVKGSSAGSPGPYADGGIVECSLFEYTDRARSGYTNGVDVLAGSDWVIRDNVFRNIRGPVGELAGPAVLMWRNSLDTVVERNLFIECDRAIALGLSSPDANSRDGETTFDHQGGVVRNNMIHRRGPGDIGITVNYARDVEVTHNTVILNGTFPSGAIEYRFAATNATITNNLTDAPIWQRNDATAHLAGNVTTAVSSWFVDESSADLHIVAGAGSAIDKASGNTAVDDFDGHARPEGPAADVGADEFGSAGVPSGFVDVPVDHAFFDDIEWMAATGITNGCNPPIDDRYCPNDPVTREQMATFLVRAFSIPSADPDTFTDTSGSVHSVAIDALAASGVTVGCNPPLNDRFCPEDVVTRGQMAAFLVRSMGLTNDGGGNGFVDDDGSVFETDIARLAHAGVTRGCNPPASDRFCPDSVVTRQEMAAFLHRASRWP